MNGNMPQGKNVNAEGNREDGEEEANESRRGNGWASRALPCDWNLE